MGNCSGSLLKVGPPPPVNMDEVGPPPSVNMDETYQDMKTSLSECYDWAFDLQETFAKKVIQDKRTIRLKKHTETQYSVMTPLSSEEAEQIYYDTNKVLEKYWFKRSETILKSIINRLKDVKKHGNVPTDKQPFLTKLIVELETDSLHLLKLLNLNPAFNQSKNDSNDTQLIDEDETDSSSEGKHNDSSNSSSYDVETGKHNMHKLDRRCVQIDDFGLLFTCNLMLETESNNYSKICNYI